jgi:DNA gyrase subunit B
VTGGLRGIGLPVVNFLSSEFIIEVQRDGYLWRQSYREGLPQSDVIPVRALEQDEPTGTTITFQPDFSILEKHDFSFSTVAERLHELAFVLPKTRFILSDERGEQPVEQQYYSETGLADFVAELNKERNAFHPVISGSREIEYCGSGKTLKMAADFAFQYVDNTATDVRGYANTVKTTNDSIHIQAMVSAITDAINDISRASSDKNAENPELLKSEVLQGLTAVVHVRLPNPSYYSQGHLKLLTPAIDNLVVGLVYEAIHSYDHRDAVEAIVQKCLANRRRKGAANTRPSPE